MLNRVDELKELEKQRLKLRANLDKAYVGQRELTKQIEKNRSQLELLEKQIATLTLSEPNFTDQAILRYLERTKHINIELVKLEMKASANQAVKQLWR